MDLTNTRSLEAARKSRKIGDLFNRIDDLIKNSKVKKITLSCKVYNEIIEHFPTEMKRRLQDGFEYKESTICPLK
jgi:hypothetical protein